MLQFILQQEKKNQCELDTSNRMQYPFSLGQLVGQLASLHVLEIELWSSSQKKSLHHSSATTPLFKLSHKLDVWPKGMGDTTDFPC